MAHEVGHNRGRQHTCSSPCRDEPGCVDQYAGGIISVYGLDLANPSTPRYLDPVTHHDLISYCPPRSISDITYGALRRQFTPAASASGGPSAPKSTWAVPHPQEYLDCSGFIVDGVVTFPRPFYRYTSATGDDYVGEGPYTLQLQDAGGTLLFTRHFNTVGDS